AIGTRGAVQTVPVRVGPAVAYRVDLPAHDDRPDAGERAVPEIEQGGPALCPGTVEIRPARLQRHLGLPAAVTNRVPARSPGALSGGPRRRWTARVHTGQAVAAARATVLIRGAEFSGPRTVRARPVGTRNPGQLASDSAFPEDRRAPVQGRLRAPP